MIELDNLLNQLDEAQKTNMRLLNQLYEMQHELEKIKKVLEGK